MWDARVRENVFVHFAALHFLHGLDFLAVLFGLIVLLPVLMEAMVSFDVGCFGSLLLAALGSTFLERLYESLVRTLPMLAFSVKLRSWFALFSVPHRSASPRKRGPSHEPMGASAGPTLPPTAGAA
jgi:hypothetical protein